MKASVVFGAMDMRMVELPVPVAGEGEVLVQVKSVGVCASDVHWYRDGRIGDVKIEDPIMLGHEFSGVIAGVGPGVTDLKPGDRVAVEPGISCLKCDMCLEENFNLCREIKFAGSAFEGAFREYLAWPAHFVEKIPDSMSMDEAAMLEPLGVGMYAVDLAGDVRGKTVGVLGAGAVGLSALQCAKAAGCGEAWVTDLIPGRLERAKKLGADQTFDAADPNIARTVMEATGGRGLDIVFECAGENLAVRQGTEMLRPLGTIVVVGIPYDDDMIVSASTVRRKGLTLRLVRRSNKTLKRCVDLVAGGEIDVKSYVTHHLPFDRILEAMDIAAERRDGALRVIVEVTP